MTETKQIAIYLNEKMQAALNHVMECRGYDNRSEAVRQLIWIAYKEDSKSQIDELLEEE